MNATIDLADPRRNGAWLVTAADLDTLAAAARADGHRVTRVSLARCRDRAGSMARIASAFALSPAPAPGWAGLALALADRARLPAAAGHAWLFEHAGSLRRADVDTFDALCRSLDDACQLWRDLGTPCCAFLALPTRAFTRGAA